MSVWLVFRETEPTRTVAAFWNEPDAQTYASTLRSDGGQDELSIVREVAVHGARVLCRLCGEPVVQDDPSDAESWIHAPDANDLADHTAEV